MIKFKISCFLLLVIFISCGFSSSLLYSAEEASQAKVFYDEIDTQIGMFSKLVFNDQGVEITFHSHELLKIAKTLVSKAKEEPIDVPEYSSYADTIELGFEIFSEEIINKYSEFYGVDGDALTIFIESFYKYGPNPLLMSGLFNEYTDIMNVIKLKARPLAPFITDEYDNLILPISIREITSIEKLFAFGRYIQSQKEPVDGWWIDIGNRLILLKNFSESKEHLYVSDHGFSDDVFRGIKRALLSFTESGSRDMLHAASFNAYFQKLTENEKGFLREQFILRLHSDFSGDPDRGEFLLYVLSLPQDLREETLKRGQFDAPWWNVGGSIGQGNPVGATYSHDVQKIVGTQHEKYQVIFDELLEGIRYRGEVQAQTFFMKLRQLSPFFTQINQIFHPEDANRYKTFFTLSEIAKSVGRGMQKLLLRPIGTFGSREKGESYRAFSEAFNIYYGEEAPLSPSDLACEMRRVLRGGIVNDDKLYFVPNLIAAWFISESARNEVSILSGLMLLDLIESGVKLIDEEGYNLYDWRYTVVHPRKPQDSRTEFVIKDLYGQDIDLANFDGTHPMAHGGSIRDSKRKIGNKQKLSPVQQKEGHLIIHWLHEKLRGCRR